MVRLRIYPDRLATRDMHLPVSPVLQMIKLTYAQAMSFKNATSFEALVSKYGKENQLQENEVYDGYVAVFYPRGYTSVVHMCGRIQRLKEDRIIAYCTPYYAQKIKKGVIWEIASENGICPEFRYVWTFRNIDFVCYLETMKEIGLFCGDVEVMGKTLQDKIVNALLSDKILEVTEQENDILIAFLGEHEYYRDFFTKVKAK